MTHDYAAPALDGEFLDALDADLVLTSQMAGAPGANASSRLHALRRLRAAANGNDPEMLAAKIRCIDAYEAACGKHICNEDDEDRDCDVCEANVAAFHVLRELKSKREWDAEEARRKP